MSRGRVIRKRNFENTVAYRRVTRQRPRNKQRVQELLCNRRINKRPFLSNGSVKTFPRKRTRNNRRTVFSIWSASRSYKEGNWGNPVQLSVESWALQGRLRRGPECWKRKISTVRSRCQRTAWRHKRLEKGLVGAVVIWELWRLTVAL
jgi:hypothetical protein